MVLEHRYMLLLFRFGILQTTIDVKLDKQSSTRCSCDRQNSYRAPELNGQFKNTQISARNVVGVMVSCKSPALVLPTHTIASAGNKAISLHHRVMQLPNDCSAATDETGCPHPQTETNPRPAGREQHHAYHISLGKPPISSLNGLQFGAPGVEIRQIGAYLPPCPGGSDAYS